MRNISFIFTALLICIITSVSLNAQTKHIITLMGEVRDSISHEPIPYVAIYLKGSNKGILTDNEGRFKITTGEKFNNLTLSVMGYKTKDIYIPYKSNKKLVLEMTPTGVELNEVIVKPKKEKYSKKNNPAVDFVKKIMAQRELTDPRRNDYYNYNKYERITIALNNFDSNKDKNLLLKKFPFLIEHIDTSEVSGTQILNVSVKEKASNVHYRKDPKSEKEYITGIKRNGIDDITSQESVQEFLEDIFREIDLYDNDINLLQNRFVSPLSRIATDFYKFYLTDTVAINGDSCVELSFAPHNPAMFGFTGRLYVIKGDSSMFIKRVKMNVPPTINLNFIDQMYVLQEFEKAPDGSRLKTRDDMTIEVSILPGTDGIYARRNTAYTNHSFISPTDPNTFKPLQKVITPDDAYTQTTDFWNQNRLIPINSSEDKVKDLVTKLRSVPLYYWTEKVIKILVSGYIHTAENSKFDLGPMNTTISHNDIEGYRFRVGGITTANLNKRLFARGYVAYGTTDQKLKYNGEVEYSFHDKKYHSREFPIHSLKLSHLYDVDMLGQHYQFTNSDNMFLSIKRQKDTQMTYHRVSNLEYVLELHNNFSINAGVKHERQEATAFMPFIDGYGNNITHYDQTSLNVQLRYAPGEKFYQTKSQRFPINFDAPIFVLSHSFSPKNFLSNRYTLNKTEFSVQKRFWFSTFGYTDIILKAGHIWNSASYPNMLLPNANLSYTIQPESYALMNPMEFVNDSYLSWDLEYWANGAIFNYLPLFKRLKLREVFSFRGLYGHLSDKNNPTKNLELFQFPIESHTRLMSNTPYMEIGAGIDNLFKCLRVDYVWRLTYRDTPNCDKHGLRIALHFTF